MSNVTLTADQIQQLTALNTVFEENQSRFSKILTFNNIIHESYALGVIESNIPESLRFDLHLDMILKSGTTTLTDYYKNMSSGYNHILEAARKIFPNDLKITESIESFREYLVSMLNENALALGAPVVSSGGIDAALDGGDLKPRAGGFWSVTKSLWNAITEGGSPIGILHFFIDIIGLVGDFIFPGVGVVADLINAAIYAARGEYMLCSISVIAAVVIGFGDSLKLVKFAAKPAEKVFVACSKGSTKEAADLLAKMGAKEKGGVLKILTLIFGTVAGALGKATSLLGKFYKGFGDKVAYYIPGLGKAVQPIFSGLGQVLTGFGKKMSLAGSTFKLATTAAKKTAAVSIEATLKAGGDFIVSGTMVKVLNKEGKMVGEYSAKQFEKIAGISIAELASKKAGSKAAAKILYKSGDDLGRVANVLANPKIQDSLRKRAFAFFEKTPVIKGSLRFGKDLFFFIGAQIYKIIFKSDFVDGKNNEWSKKEVEGHGNGAMNDWINRKIKEEMDKTGAVYLPALMLDSQDQETVDRITDYQNYHAKMLGQPTIMNVVTKTYDKNGPGEKFADFFDEVAKGEVKRGKKGDIVDHTIADDMKSTQKLRESSTRIIKTVSNFSDFNR